MRNPPLNFNLSETDSSYFNLIMENLGSVLFSVIMIRSSAEPHLKIAGPEISSGSAEVDLPDVEAGSEAAVTEEVF